VRAEAAGKVEVNDSPACKRCDRSDRILPADHASTDLVERERAVGREFALDRDTHAEIDAHVALRPDATGGHLETKIASNYAPVVASRAAAIKDQTLWLRS
jgi:hypothetical protein